VTATMASPSAATSPSLSSDSFNTVRSSRV
jgi:hypothetical protein